MIAGTAARSHADGARRVDHERCLVVLTGEARHVTRASDSRRHAGKATGVKVGKVLRRGVRLTAR